VETLRPTYRLLIGVPGKSTPCNIKRLGLFDDIIEKAKEFLTQDDIKFEDMLMSIEKNLNQSENEKMKAESYRLEAEKLKKELEEQKRKLAENRERLIQEARAEARKILLEARKEAEEIISKMRRLEQEVHNAQRQKEAEELRLKLKRRLIPLRKHWNCPLLRKTLW